MNCNYDSCSYPGIQSKFYYIPDKRPDEQNGQQPVSMDMPYYEVSFMLFRTGSILIVGKCNEAILNVIYQFICSVLATEYSTIQMGPVPVPASVPLDATTSASASASALNGGGGGIKNSRRKKLSTANIRFYESSE